MDQPPSPPPAAVPPAPARVFDRRALRVLLRPDRPGLLGAMRVRKKLVVLHTLFSLALTIILLVTLRPAINRVVQQAELDEARALLEASSPVLPDAPAIAARTGRVQLRGGSAAELGLTTESANAAIAAPGRAVVGETAELGECAVLFAPQRTGERETFWALRASIPEAREAVLWLYMLVIVAILGVYALVALSLEVFVLPQAVYRPIQRMLLADRASQDGRTSDELIPENAIPRDELGEIMRSRNATVSRLRRQEAALSDALSRLEEVASDLQRKNYLLEAARRNLADAERLASLGLMSAGIAHELNTPLVVVKGLAEKLNTAPREGLEPTQAALLVRVVRRLERLGESLLDFARVRPPQSAPASLQAIAAEAITLVKLDREAAGTEFQNVVPPDLIVPCDADRMVQVLLNLVRNAVDALRSAGRAGCVRVQGEFLTREGRRWAGLTVIDDGPGMDPDLLPRLFEPFASTRLDARGTGLGLAVAQGIISEHGGVLLARNRTDRTGAIFEIILPADASPAADAASPVPQGVRVP